MRLIEIIAEWSYIKDVDDKPLTLFSEQDSNVRDFYFREAYNQIPGLVAGYLRNDGDITKRIRGCVKSFSDAHGTKLTKENAESLVKRIISNLRR